MLLYIHIPFCESKCPYCAFGSVTNTQALTGGYFDALLTDIKFQIDKFKISKFSSVFIGGGTPSAVSAKFYKKIFAEISPFCNDKTEITSEANPNSANLRWLKDMRNLGVNRISFGAQSFFDDKLELLGRAHNCTQIYKAVQNAKNAGFRNINIDLIYATKLDNKKRLAQEALALKNLGVTHASAYSLTLEENTPFERKFELRNDSAALAKFMMKQIENIGLKQYEVSNFGKPCKHNLGYWQGKEYIGAGAYSVGFMRGARYYAQKDLARYIASPTHREIEILNDDELRMEHVFLGARSCVGIDERRLTPRQRQRAEILRRSRKLKFERGRYFVKNFLLADEVALFING